MIACLAFIATPGAGKIMLRIFSKTQTLPKVLAMARLWLCGVTACLLTAAAFSEDDIVVANADCGSSLAPDEPEGKPGVLVRSLSEISEALTRETNHEFEIPVVRRTATFKLLVGAQSVGLWNELILRSGDDLVLPIAGLMCIEQERPELAFDAAVRCIIASSRPTNPLMGYPAQILQKGARERKSTDRIARIFESGAGSDASFAVLVAALTRVDLIACFEALDVGQCAASRLAWFVCQIESPGLDDLDEKIRSKYSAALASLATAPGLARCEYLRLVDGQAENVKECLRLAILDPDINQLYLIPALRRFGKKYSSEISAWLESAQQDRRTFVRKHISR